MSIEVRAIVKYPGAKWSIAGWIVSHLPSHRKYIEPYFGSGAVFFNKEPAAYEVINDLSGDVVNFFQVLRSHSEDLACLLEMTAWARGEWELSCAPTEDPLERARRFVTHTWQSFGRGIPGAQTGWKTKSTPYTLMRWSQLPNDLCLIAERLRNTQIENQPGIDVIRRHQAADVLIYADPPYPLNLRRRFYPHEMSDEDHAALLDVLDQHPGPVVLSGYHCPLYDARLAHWQTYERCMTVEQGKQRTEVLWLNPVCTESPGLFAQIAP